MSWQWRMMQNLKRNWLVSSKLTWGIWRILTWTLENLKTLHFNGLHLSKAYSAWGKKKCRKFMFDGTEDWKFMFDGTENLKENWLVFSRKTRRIWQIVVHSLKNSYFILESKMKGRNQNKKSKQPHWPDAVWKF